MCVCVCVISWRRLFVVPLRARAKLPALSSRISLKEPHDGIFDYSSNADVAEEPPPSPTEIRDGRDREREIETERETETVSNKRAAQKESRRVRSCFVSSEITVCACVHVCVAVCIRVTVCVPFLCLCIFSGLFCTNTHTHT